MKNLSLDLAPLRLIVQEEKLDLAHDLILSLTNLILLHLERTFDVSKQQLSILQLLLGLVRPILDHAIRFYSNERYINRI